MLRAFLGHYGLYLAIAVLVGVLLWTGIGIGNFMSGGED